MTRSRRKDTVTLQSGKIPHDLLDSLLARYTSVDERVIEGPATGIDATLLRFSGDVLFAKTDPVTFVTENMGHYVVNVNANDLAAMGGEPRWFMATLLFPAGATDPDQVESVFSGIRKACDELSVAFCGGHTEVTSAVTRAVAGGTMLGLAMANRTFQASLARAGDCIVLTSGVAVEGTSIIAREKSQEVSTQWGEDFLARCTGYLRDPGISVLPPARAACRVDGVHAMHDPTEGGLATALHELADASGTGFIVRRDSIPIFRETSKLCARYGMDPLGLIASGALLIAVEEEHLGELEDELEAAGSHPAVIGRLLDEPGVRKIVTLDVESNLERFESDEILKLWNEPGRAPR